MSWVEFSSEGIGNGASTYYVAKYPIRKQWALMCDDGTCSTAVAYFRAEHHARHFAATFGLTITDHNEALS